MGLPIINLSLIPTFPARVFGSGPVVITKAGLDYTFGLDVSTYSLNPAPSGMAYVLSYDPSTGSTELIPVGGVAADWDSIVNKPATFPPSAHTHPISQVDNLQVALDAKIATTAIGTTVQGWDADLDAIAALSGTNNIYYRSGAATWSSVTISTGLTFTGGALTWNGFNTRKNSTGSVFTRRRLNLIEGTGITLTVADDAPNDEVDVTVAVTGSGFAPLPQSASGVGQWLAITSTAGGALALPAGGTWAWSVVSFSSGAFAVAFGADVSAGGTTVRAASGSQIHTGFAWRIA